MSTVFLKLINMSLTASWLILLIIPLRLMLKKAPKWIACVLWAFVAVRLICPFSIESAFSLIPGASRVETTVQNEAPYIQSGVSVIDNAASKYLSNNMNANDIETSTHFFAKPINVISVIWAVGMIFIIAYGLISYLRLKKKVSASVQYKSNVYKCDDIISPFILGVFRPRIYLPSGMDNRIMDNVIAHEVAHIKRHDHFWKPLGYMLVAMYWFNPLIWIAYILFCRDIELACDEKVISNMDATGKADYSEALLSCSIPRRMVAACPLAFGEVGVKKRIKGVLNYKKPTFWIIAVALITCIMVAVCFLTNPSNNDLDSSNKNDKYKQVIIDWPTEGDGSVKSEEPVVSEDADKSESPILSEDPVKSDNLIVNEDELPPAIATANYDIDGDGKVESCALTYGPTSGLFTVVFTVSYDGVIKYKNTFNMPWSRELAFYETEKGLTLVENTGQSQDAPGETIYHLITVEDGRIVIHGYGDRIFYWGGEDWNLY